MPRIGLKWILAVILWLLSAGSAFIFTLMLVIMSSAGTAGQGDTLTLIFSAVMAVAFMIAGIFVAFRKAG
jgi:hypothetical protein